MCVSASVLDSLGVVTVGTDRAALNQTADSLMASGSSLEELTDLLSAAGDTVDRTKGLNLKNLAALHHLEVIQLFSVTGSLVIRLVFATVLNSFVLSH